MGRPFARELSFIPATIRQAGSLQLEKLPVHVNEASSGHVILVGAGGSLSAAEFCQKLFDERGIPSQAMTPLAFLESKAKLHDVSIFIFTARGNNKDVLAAFSSAQNREAKKIIVICASNRSKIADLALKCAKAYTFTFRLSSGRDGYLATNSLIATCVVLARAFNKKPLNPDEAEAWVEIGKKGFGQLRSKRNHFTILYSGWAKIAAVDLESKLSESGVASSMLVDYRHFAHGRHNWLDKQGSITSVVALSSTEGAKLSDTTLKYFPSEIPVWKCNLGPDGAESALKLLLAIFGFVMAAAQTSGIDPGRPGVPDYGAKLYGLGPMEVSTVKPRMKSAILVSACERKAPFANNISKLALSGPATRFINTLTATRFDALVIDYDGTVLPLSTRGGAVPIKTALLLKKLLLNQVPLFFATGRGDSIQGPLRKALPKKAWPLVHIGYYNGAIILPLVQTEELAALKPDSEFLKKAENEVKEHPLFGSLLKIKNKFWQLSIEPVPSNISCNVTNLLYPLKEHIAKLFGNSLRVVMSSHSLDILPVLSSKVNCLKAAEQIIRPGGKVLAIGDCGALDGNDYELLCHPYSLSVNSVSTALDSCWNFLPRGISHADGLLFYLELLTIRKGSFFLKSPI